MKKHKLPSWILACILLFSYTNFPSYAKDKPVRIRIGTMAPKDTPDAILSKLSGAVTAAVKSFARYALAPSPMRPA